MADKENNGIWILVVDDEEDLRESLKRKFARHGFNVATAESGNKALQVCQSHAFDVVLTDVRMANGTGIELLDGLKKQFGYRCPAVICMSAFSDLTTEGAYLKGADALFPKPVDPAALLAAIMHFYNSRKQRLAAAERSVA
ncbi:MAG: response regulator [Bdellovibrionales bacterium]|nr:response regulator [Bdellovibrionales bacterium]